MNPVYKAKQFIEEAMISAGNSFSASSSFISESLEKGFCNSRISGFDSCDPSDAVIGVGTLGNGQLEVALDGRVIPHNSICECFGNDFCRKIMLNRASLRVVRMPRSKTYFQVKQGDKIGHGNLVFNQSYGSLGAFVINKDRAPYFISNKHVLAPGGDNNLGDPIYHSQWNNVQIGTLLAYIPIYLNWPNSLDLAIARNDTDYQFSFGRGVGFREPVMGEWVTKTGATTGRTRGRIVSVDYSTKVQYDNQNATFVDQVFIVPSQKGTAFSMPGDSGSIIYAESDGAVVGLLFAGNQLTTTANNAIAVRDQLIAWGAYE